MSSIEDKMFLSQSLLKPLPEWGASSETPKARVSGLNTNTPSSMEEVAKEFEKMFVDMMIKSMRKATYSEEKKSNAEDMYRGMLDDEYARAMVESTNFGIRDMIMQQEKLLKKS